MKTYLDHTQEELLAFSDEEIEKLIDLQCALDGVPLLPPEPEPFIDVKADPDTVVYGVAGFYFADNEQAQQVARLINSLNPIDVDYNWGAGDRQYYIRNNKSKQAATIEAIDALSAELRKHLETEKTKTKDLKKQYEAMKAQYDRVFDLRQEVSGRVWDEVWEARKIHQAKLDAIHKFDRYVLIANGDKQQAYKFFEDAYPNELRHLSDLKDDIFSPVDEAEAKAG